MATQQSQSSAVLTFTLPPPALAAAEPASAPVSTSRGKKRRAPGSATGTTHAAPVTLPPPPTRTRKIIQMNPGPSSSPPSSGSSSTSTTTTTTTPTTTKSKTPATKAKTAAAKTSTTTSPNSAASTSRKVARKTAHSLIERRRRSKMNAEFETLKNLVPACGKGVEMHKLAILQASIEYVRYLEGCLKELQKAAGVQNCCAPPVFSPRSQSGEEDEDEDEDDVDMDADQDTRELEREDELARQQREQLEMQFLLQEQQRRYSQPEDYPTSNYTTNPSSVATSPDFAPIHSAAASPLFTLPPAHGIRLPSISPMIFPQPQPPMHSPLEATAGALLLLADEGRRDEAAWRFRTSTSGRGMSVRDLLSS